MNLNLLLVPRVLAPAGLLILALTCSSAQSAGDISPIVFSGRAEDDRALSLREEKNELTLREAAHLALQHNPELAAFAKEIRALQGATHQAGLLRNPELSVNVENVGNTQPLRGDINSQQNVAQEVVQQLTTIRIYQLIEVGGKRTARVNAALMGQEVAGKDYEAKRVELISRVANVFTDVLAAQEQLRLAEESRQLAQRVVDTVAKRVQAGKAPPIEETRVEVAFSTTQIALVQAQRDLVAARKRLTLLWGNSSPQFKTALGDLQSFIALPSFEALEQRVLISPLALRGIKSVEQRKALLEVQRTRRIPDVTLSAGVVHHAQLGGNTPVVSLAVPLPLFDRNQGNLREANQRVDKAMDEQLAVELRLKTELTQAYQALSAAQDEIDILRSSILPKAKSAFEVTNKGYELGKFGFLEVLDAQRTLFQNQVLYVRSLANYQRLVNEIERLIAARIDAVPDDVSNPEVNESSANTGLGSRS